MEPIEWCSLRTAPVYPLHTLLRIAAGDHKGPPRSRRKASKRRAIRSAFPWPLEGHTVRFLPRLRAIIVIPDAPPTDIVGVPIPALTLDRVLRRKGRVFSGRNRRRTAIVETAYGFDRYDIAPAGLVRCIANVTPPMGSDHWCPPAGNRRERVTQRRSVKTKSLHWYDRLALAAAAIAVVIVATPAPEPAPAPDATHTHAPQSGSRIGSVPPKPGASRSSGSRSTTLGTRDVLPEAFLVETFPEGQLSRVVREGNRVVVTIETSITDRHLPYSYPHPYPSSIDEFEIVRSGNKLIVSAGWRLR